ncbi:hypothetical protein Y600_5900 [Burkholderia pseudomallei MSHR3709]|nr:hypothetical protein Y600_5900 [Burkholderia pseudomallei MSHR3709]
MFVADSVVHGFEQGRGLSVVSNAPRSEAWARVVRSGLRRSPSIPMLARQGADLRMSTRLISGDVTVYLPPKSTVYRQVYRHVLADSGGSDETMVDSQVVKNRVISMAYGHPETWRASAPHTAQSCRSRD